MVEKITDKRSASREAWESLETWVEEERLPAGLLRGLIVYLDRARHDPQLRFAASMRLTAAAGLRGRDRADRRAASLGR